MGHTGLTEGRWSACGLGSWRQCLAGLLDGEPPVAGSSAVRTGEGILHLQVRAVLVGGDGLSLPHTLQLQIGNRL